MTTRTTVGQAKQGFWGVVSMTAATAALLGGVLLFQLRPSGDATAPTTASHSQVSDGGIQRSDAEMFSRVQTSTATTPERGGMTELYREQRAAAASVQERHTVYVVRSTEDATALREFLASIRSASGLPPVAVNMLVSDFDADTLAQDVPRTPGTTFIDLRPVRSAPQAAAPDHMGGMAELYGEQRNAAGQHNARVECGDGVQPALCY